MSSGIVIWIKFYSIKKRDREFPGSPVVRVCSSTAGGMGSIPGPGNKILHSTQCGQKKKKKKEVKFWHMLQHGWTLKQFWMKQARHKRTNIVCFHFHVVPRIDTFIKTENWIVVTRGWGTEEMRNYCLMGTEFHFGKMKRSGDGWSW